MIRQISSLLTVTIVVFAAIAGFSRQASSAAPEPTYLAAAAEYCRVELDDPGSNLNVRTYDGRVIGKLRHGTRVWVNEYSGEWARVSVKRGKRWAVVGWVDSSFLVCG